MTGRGVGIHLVLGLLGLLLAGCGDTSGSDGATGSGGGTTVPAGVGGGTGGAAPTAGAGTGAAESGGTSAGSGATATSGSSGGGGTGTGGDPPGGAGGSSGASGSSGVSGSSGASGSGGNSGAGGTSGGACSGRTRLGAGGDPFDCGTSGQVLENAGRPDNRVNYVILGDGYTADLLDTLFIAHIENMLHGDDGFFSELGEPYSRYRSFVNVCALKVASNDACIDDEDTGLQCDTAFAGHGDDVSRLGGVDRNAVRDAIAQLLPANIDVDWTAVTINAGADNWWNSGGSIMVWNGSFVPQSRSASVALHEGGHAFHRLADEYDGDSTNCSDAAEANVTTDSTGAKWAEWLGFDHDPGSGLHGVYEGARYCRTGVYRPTPNSQMNILPDYFNMPSIQKMVHDFYAIVRPIDAHTANDTTLVNPEVLEVRVVDPAVLRVEWSVDGAVVAADGGECFDPAALGSGDHTVTARAVDDTPWVRNHRDDLEQSVTWAVTIQ